MIRQLTLLSKRFLEINKGSLKPKIFVCVIMCLFGLLTVNCGPITTQQEYNIPETETSPTIEKTTQIHSTQGSTNLPETAAINFKKLPYLKHVFQTPMRVDNRKTLFDFFMSTRTGGHKTTLIMNCSLDILKAFVANGWAPIVMIRMGNRRPIILPVSYYDDNMKTVHLQNPSDLSKRRLSYEDFQASWKIDPRSRCILITPEWLSETRIQSVLAQYLPKEAYQQIKMETR